MFILELTLLIGLVLICFSFLYYFSSKTTLPYTVILLLFGLIGKELFSLFHLPTDIDLSSDVTYFILLPILLFGSALHLNFHQFRMQFKTISFMATFGLLVSVAVVGGILSLALGWDITTGLLFGAMISATDPIAVLALFQALGGPRRLALLADGESMLNDATAVVLFRILTTIIIGGSSLSQQTFIHSVTEFGYVFIGSLLIGALYGYIVSWFLSKIENNLLVETTLTLGAALIVFTAAEHFLHLSGVIAAVVAGLFVGNLGRSRISPQVAHFVHEFWDYLGFLAVSFVFFFATFHLELSFLIDHFPEWLWVVGAVLIARALSVYGSTALSNRLAFFKDEPNVPLSWQHILNWGGLRGVIPLVLVFTLPDTYEYKELLFDFTLSTLLFTLFVNGSTMGWLLKRLKLHLPSEAEKVRRFYDSLFDIDAAIKRVKGKALPGISRKAINHQIRDWEQKEEALLAQIDQVGAEHYTTALAMQALIIERSVYEKLLERQEISEAAFYELDAQLDLQADAIEYPELRSRMVDAQGRIKTAKLFRQRVLEMRSLVAKYPLLCRIFKFSKERLYIERYLMVRSRLIGSKRVLGYLEALAAKNTNKTLAVELKKLQKQYQFYHTKAQEEVAKLKSEVNCEDYEQQMLSHALVHQHSPWVF